MKARDFLHKAITSAYCMDYRQYLEVMGMQDGAYAKSKWKLQQQNFGKWFVQLDAEHAGKFIIFVGGLR